jgi:hypothetical protein
MLTLRNKQPVTENPFYKLGVSGVALQSKTVDEAVQLARAIARTLRTSPSAPKELAEMATECINELNNREAALAAFNAYKGMTPEQVTAKDADLRSEMSALSDASEMAVWKYQVDRGAPQSLTNATRLSPATITATDIIQLLRSPVKREDPLARKLFKRELISLGEGELSNGVPLPSAEQSRRELVGVLHLKALNRAINLSDVDNVIRALGLINLSSLSLEHYQLPTADGATRPEKVKYPSTDRSQYTHFFPIEALNRLLVVKEGDISGGIRAKIPAANTSSCNILLSRCASGKYSILCIEGIIEEIAENSVGTEQSQQSAASMRTSQKKTARGAGDDGPASDSKPNRASKRNGTTDSKR